MRVFLGKTGHMGGQEYRRITPFSMGEMGVHIAEVPSSNLGAPTTLPQLNQSLSSRGTDCSTVVRGRKVVPSLWERRHGKLHALALPAMAQVGSDEWQEFGTRAQPEVRAPGPLPPLMSS